MKVGDIQKEILRNQIYYGNFCENSIGSEQSGERPFVVVQNNKGNLFSPNLIVAPLTTIDKEYRSRKKTPTQVGLLQDSHGKLKADSLILTEQIRTISKERLIDSEVLGELSNKEIEELDEALRISVGLNSTIFYDAELKRGDIYFVDFGDGVKSEIRGKHPAIVVQNDLGNHFSPTTIVAPIVTKKFKSIMPTQIILEESYFKGTKKSIVQTEQIRTVEKTRLLYRLGAVPKWFLRELNKRILVSLGL